MGTISATPITDQIYSLGDPPLVFSFPDFTYSLTCSDLVWTYEVTLNNSLTLPAFINFQISSLGGGSFTVSTTNINDKGTYVLNVTGFTPNMRA